MLEQRKEEMLREKSFAREGKVGLCAGVRGVEA